MSNNRKIAMPDRSWAAFDSEHVCYVVQAESGGPFKIGNAIRMSKRLAGLQNGNPDLLVVRALFSGGRETEKHIHLLLHDHRLVGEWFSADAVALICDLVRSDSRLLWGVPWSAEVYRQPPPTSAHLRARLRAILVKHTILDAVEELLSDKSHPVYQDALRVLESHSHEAN